MENQLLLVVFGIAVAAVVAVAALWIWWRSPGRRRRRSGRSGERKVARTLRRLRHKDFIVLNDLLIPSSSGRTAQIDHVVISTRGIFVIETKSHVGRITGSERGQYWEQRLWLRSRSFYNPLLQNRSHISALRRHLRGLPADLFISMVVFTAARRVDVSAEDIVEHRTFWFKRRISRTFDPERSVRRRWWQRGRGVVLDDSTIVVRLPLLVKEMKRRERVMDRETMEEVAEKIVSLDIRGSGARRQHRAFARQAAKSTRKDIRHGICPRCGGKLVEKTGDYGPFLGCSNFPECRFVCKSQR